MDYTGWNKDQLKDEASKRGLPVSGTNQELIDRLVEHDNNDLLGPTDRPPAPSATPEAPTPPPAAETPTAAPAPAEAPKTFTVLYECPGELSTGVHQENLRRCWNDAAAAGHTPRGGAFAAARTGFTQRDGKRYAVYEIPLVKPRG